jgi:hypothetical protein
MVEFSHDIPKFMHADYGCMAPVGTGFCGEKTSKSHSIPKSASLAEIQAASHVYTFQNGPNVKPKHESLNGFQSISINRASTFPGFCPKHDNVLFRQIDDAKQEVSYKSSILQCLRAICYESAIHSRGALFNAYVREDAEFDYPFDQHGAALETALMFKWARHSWKRKTALEKKINRRSPRRFLFIAGKIPTRLPFASLGSCAIEVDFQGNRLQDNVLDKEFAFVESWVIPTRNETIFGFGSIEDLRPRVLQSFLNSFSNVKSRFISNALLQYAVANIENTYFEPRFIESLSIDQRKGIKDLFDQTTIYSVGQSKPTDALSRLLPISLPNATPSFASNL